jgi:AIPR protein
MSLPCLKITSEHFDYDAYLAAIPGAILADVYEKYGTRLLELNVRAFLGVRGRKSVNAALRRTIQEEPARFLAYNNGIVATADNIEIAVEGGISSIRSMRGLQIVNGGQTTASLHRARKQDKAALDGIMVPAKIIQVRAESLDSMVAAVSRSANSQNTIQPADFSANDPFHIAVEMLANNTWLPDHKGRWFYERARGSYGAAEAKASFSAVEKHRFASETPKARRFSKTDLAKYINAWDGFPHLVSFGNQKNFQYFMQRLKEEHPNGLRPDTEWFKVFIAKAIMFRSVQVTVKKQGFGAYQANIVAYTFACIAWKIGDGIDFDLIWSSQAISTDFESMIMTLANGVNRLLRETAGARMPSEWAKKDECWIALREIKVEAPDSSPPELRVPITHAESGSPDHVRTGKVSLSDLEADDFACNIRQLFNGGQRYVRDDAIAEMAKMLGCERVSARVKEELDNALRTAVRRGIVVNTGGEFALSARSITDYERDFLKEQFLASMQGRSWAEREESIRKFARWLGFRRTGPAIDDAARSVINGLIRANRLESSGSQIRRVV